MILGLAKDQKICNKISKMYNFKKDIKSGIFV